MTTSPGEQPRSWRADIITGALLTPPILIVFSAVGMTFGVVATQGGLPVWSTLLMSLLVFAGAAQLAAVQLILAGVSPLSIILTTAVINSRFLVLSASIAPYLRGFSLFERTGFASQMTDTSYAIHAVRFRDAPPRRAEVFTMHLVSHFAWMAGTVAGIVIGRSVIDFEAFAVDFAMPAMFVALLIPLVRHRAQLVVVFAAGGSAVAFNLLGFGNWTTLAATVAAVTVVRSGEVWLKRRSS